MKLLIRYAEPDPDTISTILDSMFLLRAPMGVEVGRWFFTTAPSEEEKKIPTPTEEANKILDLVLV